ncbi:MAG: hypothetical protein JRI38_06835, partial [Deltaproteobacteria bacterium]|nr:hypothetical protein [Deltaproteobacteria bacterium]
MLPEFYQFYHPTKMIFGEGLSCDFTHELEELNVKKYFLISDHVLHDLGLPDNVKKGIQQEGFTITGQFLDV